MCSWTRCEAVILILVSKKVAWTGMPVFCLGAESVTARGCLFVYCGADIGGADTAWQTALIVQIACLGDELLFNLRIANLRKESILILTGPPAPLHDNV